ncbi:MAG: PIN domain-containing protein [Thermoflexales bacterium]|nr:PIN domain-containing protein [Thermoflexales bacterium]
MKVYLDMCAIQRPLDTPNQVRILLEAEAVLGLLALCEAGTIELISSEALMYENEQNPLDIRREYGYAVLARATCTVNVTPDVQERASQFLRYGIKPLDALHLALAEAGQADYFCTCDDRLRRQAQRVESLAVRVVSPIELIQEIEKW